MPYNDEVDIQTEITKIKEELASLGDKSIDISMQEKMLRHRLYDLEYELKHR